MNRAIPGAASISLLTEDFLECDDAYEKKASFTTLADRAGCRCQR